MNRTGLTDSRLQASSSMMWFAALLIVVAVGGLTWALVQDGPSTTLAEEVIPERKSAKSESVTQPHLITGVRPADAYSIKLEQLRRQAQIVSGWDGPTAYSVAMEELARAGRQSYVSSRLPTTANDYALYLETLRQMGQAAQSNEVVPADAHEFSEWLDQLRRLND